ncbi:YceI family protein [candidate division KSB1 bacterium]|nr:YceI family protein [candidate division KSB1 bacterium]
MIRNVIFSLTAISALSLAAFAGSWDVDQAHSKVGFTVTHMVISTVDGNFGMYTASVSYDEQYPSSLAFEAAIDASSVNTNNEKRDGHLKSPDFFDVANSPTITFKSTKTEVVSPGKFKVTGDLTMRGVTKSVVLDLSGLDKIIDTPWGTRKTAAVATGEINRHDFNLKWDNALPGGDLIVSEKVKLNIVVELDQKKE